MKKVWLTVLAAAVFCLAAEVFNGPAAAEITVFRPSTGLWAVRGVTRFYFGRSGDVPLPGDYTGNGAIDYMIFRPSTGLWALRGLTRVYFGGTGDEPKPGDYTGEGLTQAAIFRPSTGLWAVLGVTRAYFGTSGDAALAPQPLSGGLLQTGQTVSQRPGDDGDYQKGYPFRYINNGDGTITDGITGLMWARDGNGLGCNSGIGLEWPDAIDWAEALTFAGYSDWRLPNRRELESILDFGRRAPAIEPTIFPNTTNDRYWTATIDAGDPAFAWFVDFDDGKVSTSQWVDSCRVRAVRGPR